MCVRERRKEREREREREERVSERTKIDFQRYCAPLNKLYYFIVHKKREKKREKKRR